MYELPSFRVQIEHGTISIYCQDERLISKELDEEYRNFIHKHLPASGVEGFLERITAEFYSAGVKAGREEIIKKLKKIKEAII